MAKSSVTIAISGSYNGRAMAKAEEDLRRLRVRTAAEMGGAAGAITDFGGKLGEAGGRIHDFGYGMEQVGSKATRALTVPIAAAAAACGAAAVEIDTSLTNVRKTVDGTEQQYNQLKEAAIEFSKTNAVSASQILDIQALGAQLGYSIDELQEFGEVVSGLDIATNMSADEAATELAQFANIMGMAHDQTRNYGSTIVELGNNFATTEADVSHMAMRIAGAGKQIGLSEADVLGLATALSSMGIEAEAGGTAISTIMAQIDKDVAKGTAGLDRYAKQAGMTAGDFAAAMRDNADQFKDLAAANGMTLKALQGETVGALDSLELWASTANMSAADFAKAWGEDAAGAISSVLVGMDKAVEEGGNMSIMIEDLGITSIRQTDTLKRLASNSEFLGDAVKTANRAWEENSALQAEVDNRNQSMAARLEMLKNKVTAVAEEVGTPLVNAALEFVDAADPVLDVVSGAAEAFAAMDEEDQKMVVGLVAAAAAFGPVVTGGGKVLAVAGDLIAKTGRGVQTFGGFIGSLKDTGVAAGVAQKAVGGLNTAMKLSAAGLAIGLIADLVGQFQSYCAHEQLVEEATAGLASAFEETSASAEGSAPGVESMGAAIQSTVKSAEECLQAQSELAAAIRESWGGVQADAAMVDGYTATIELLAGKSDLSAQQQTELKLAVEGLNDATGSSIEVIDAQNGALSESTEAILANADAWRKKAEAEALQEMYKDLLRQNYENAQALTAATNELSAASEGWGVWIGDFPVLADDASVKYHELQQNVDDLTAAQGATADSMDWVMDRMTAMSGRFESLDAALEFAGASMGDFQGLTEEKMRAVEASFDGSLSSIVSACRDQGVRIPPSLAAAMGEQVGVLDGASYNIGAAIQAGVQKGIVDGDGESVAAMEATAGLILESARGIFGIHSPSKETEQMGLDLNSGLANGLTGGKGEPEGAMEAMGRAVLGSLSFLAPSAQGAGSEAGQSLASGLSSKFSAAAASGLGLASSAKGGLAGAPAEFNSVGARAAGGFSSAVSSASAYGAGSSLARSGKQGLESVSAASAGRNFAQGFGNGMRGVDIWGAAYNVGMSALGAIKSALGIHSPSREAMAVGEFFGEGAILGMEKTVAGIEAEADKMSRAMELNPGPVSAPQPAPVRPDPSAAYHAAYGSAAGRPIALNVTINVTVQSAEEGRQVGKSIGEELYNELVRLERASGR